MRTSTWVLSFALLIACGDDAGDAPGEDASAPCTVDADCDDGTFCNGAETCAEGACESGSPPCAAGQSCIEATMECSDECVDADGDGQGDVACGGLDCDDTDPDRFVGNTEICDAADRDEDCDMSTFGFRDQDMDGAPDANCCNGTNCGADCDDMRATVGGSPIESCDGLDNDCDGTVDEGVQQTFYPDVDMDGYGDPDGTPMIGCMPPVGFVSLATDCNDTDDEIHPGAFDRCDPAMVDDDCDGTPNNPTMGCTCTTGGSCPEQRGACAGSTFDCVDGEPQACSYLPQLETCNDVDEDCDGMVDEGLPTTTYYRDSDADGFGDMAMSQEACADPGDGWVINSTDCDDTDADAFPGQTGWFDSARNGGGFDYDCSGTEEVRRSNGGCRCAPTSTCQTITGYYSPPGDRDGCGTDAILVTSCGSRGGSSCTMTSQCMPSGTAVNRECH